MANGHASFIIAIDAGGTYTRVACFGLDGSLLSRSIGRGGSPTHNHDAAANVAAAMADALAGGDLQPGSARALVVGSAGVSRVGSNQGTGSNEWVDTFYRLPTLDCPRMVVNDAVTAHRGAFAGEPGVVVVAGTGSMILAITEDDTEIESGQFEHYAGGARHLVFDVMQRIFTDEATPKDGDLLAIVLSHWGARDIPDLRRVVLRLGSVAREHVKRLYGGLAPEITAAADTSPLADAALRSLTDRTVRGVRLLSPFIATTPVAVALTGALASDPAFAIRLEDSLADAAHRIVPAALDGIGGAAILAYGLAGIPVDDALVDRIKNHTQGV